MKSEDIVTKEELSALLSPEEHYRLKREMGGELGNEEAPYASSSSSFTPSSEVAVLRYAVNKLQISVELLQIRVEQLERKATEFDVQLADETAAALEGSGQGFHRTSSAGAATAADQITEGPESALIIPSRLERYGRKKKSSRSL